MDSRIEESMDEANPGTSWRLRLKRWEESHPGAVTIAASALGMFVACFGFVGLWLVPRDVQLVCLTLFLGVPALYAVACVIHAWRSGHGSLVARLKQSPRLKEWLSGHSLLRMTVVYVALWSGFRAVDIGCSMSEVFCSVFGFFACGMGALLVVAWIGEQWPKHPRPLLWLCFMFFVTVPVTALCLFGFCAALCWLVYFISLNSLIS